MRIKRGSADQSAFHFKGEVQHIQDLDGLTDNFRTDAITWQNCDFHGFYFAIIFVAAQAIFTWT